MNDLPILNNVTLETPAETRARVKAHGADWFGDNVVFSLPGGTHKVGHVLAIYEHHGLKKYLPSRPRAETQLNRASSEGKRNGFHTSAFDKPNKDTPAAIQIARIEGEGESGDDLNCLARVRIAFRIDPTTGEREPFAVAKPPEGQTGYTDMAARDRAIWVAHKCNTLLHNAENKDLGRWLRAALRGAGCIQSRGGGNNFYVPRGLADSIHALLSDLKSAGMLGYHDRTPKTSLGAPHEKAKMAEAVTTSFADEIIELRDQMRKAAKRAGKRGQDKFLDGQLENVRDLDNKFLMFQDVVEERLAAPLREAMELYRQNFQTLRDGGSVSEDWMIEDDEATPDTARSPESTPESEPKASAAPPAAPSSTGEMVAAANGSDDDDFACFM